MSAVQTCAGCGIQGALADSKDGGLLDPWRAGACCDRQLYDGSMLVALLPYRQHFSPDGITLDTDSGPWCFRCAYAEAIEREAERQWAVEPLQLSLF